jgi:hypothetical protein
MVPITVLLAAMSEMAGLVPDRGGDDPGRAVAISADWLATV